MTTDSPSAIYISYTRGKGREYLVYSPQLGRDECAPESIQKEISLARVRESRSSLASVVEKMVFLAGQGRDQATADLMDEADTLAREILPDHGLGIAPGAAIALDLQPGQPWGLPWELLLETKYSCPKCGPGPQVIQSGAARDELICPRHQIKMPPDPIPLALRYDLTLQARGEGSPAGNGKLFLMAIDPREDLLAPQYPSTNQICDGIMKLSDQLQALGFEVVFWSGRQVEVRKVVGILRNPDLAGVYYFGHGTVKSGQGTLVLADGGLTAKMISDARPAARFVFLNACRGAQSGRSPKLDWGDSQIATAFARGDNAKTVIASVGPIVSDQAAAAALMLFEHASAGLSFGQALHLVREHSFGQYRLGHPDLSWFSYRCFGDLSQRLQDPGAAKNKRAGRAESAQNIAARPSLNPVESLRADPPKGSRLEYGIDLAALVKTKSQPPVIGRIRELQEVVSFLSMGHNDHPIIIGEKGVGKSSILHGLAVPAESDPARPKPEPRKIVLLSMADFKKAAQNIPPGETRNAAQIMNPDQAWIALDDLHVMIRTMQADPEAQPALALLSEIITDPGGARLIATSSSYGYLKYIKSATVFSTRFKPFFLDTPSRAETLAMVQKFSKMIETKSKVKIRPDARSAAVDLSGIYIDDRQWPSKAYLALDQAAMLAQSQGAPGGPVEVNEGHVAQAVARITRVPAGDVAARSQTGLEGLARRIGARVPGRTGLIDRLTRAVTQRFTADGEPNKPRLVMLFIGPRGSGKSEMARVMAQELFAGAASLIRMNEYPQISPTSGRKKTGADAGGPDQSLYHDLLKRPCSVLLYQTIEKLPPPQTCAIADTITQGFIADPHGLKADIRNTIVIFTAHLPGLGGDISSGQATMNKQISKHLPAVLVEQIDEIILFSGT